MTPMAITGGEVGAWVAAIAGGIALVSQAWQAIKKRKQEKDEINDALQHAPEVRKQLEIGNVGEAVRHLNVIMESQARYITQQDARQVECDREIERLKDREEALETEARGWETRYNELERQRAEDLEVADRKIARIQAEMEEMKRTFARTLAQARQTDPTPAPGDEPDADI